MLFTLAFDHRNSLRTQFFGLTDPATPADHARAREAKEVIFEGLLEALGAGVPASGRAAVLVDDEYGAGVAERARGAGVVVALATEQSGRRELAFEHEPPWRTLVTLRPDYAKVLVRYNARGDAAANTRQRAKLMELQTWLGAHGIELMLELLVPAEASQLEELGGDVARYDGELRPALTVQAVEELGADGLAPRLWKLEGLSSTEEYAAVAAAVAGLGRADAGCLVLGRGADPAAVDRWLSLAAPVPGFEGFAVGRTLWWHPLRAYFGAEASRAEAAAAIGANYTRLVRVYLDAATPS